MKSASCSTAQSKKPRLAALRMESAQKLMIRIDALMIYPAMIAESGALRKLRND